MEGEVLVLQNSIKKAFLVTVLGAVGLGSADDPPAGGGRGGVTPQAAAAPAPHLAKTADAPSKEGASSGCPESMVLVDGDHCPDAEHTCLKWLDPPPYQNLRCGEYAKPAKCKGPRQHKRFCIDREEFPEPKSALPVVNRSWLDAKATCEGKGARLCKESEWEFACEGPEINPYPYGFRRDSSACNIDRTDLGGPNEKLTDHRAGLSTFPQCKSPFGVHHMTGNVDEWVEREGVSAPNRAALRGGWWLPGRNRCRAATLGHQETYSGKQVGFRCCRDPG
jgi:formylglycine-generating enzyme